MEIGFFNETDVNLDSELKTVEQVLKHGLKKLGIKEAVFKDEVMNDKVYTDIYRFGLLNEKF